jgi:chromosome segregation ATPase
MLGASANTAKSASSVANSGSGGEPVAVLALSESGEILAAREACGVIFGRDPASLVGQNICMLLKDGFDNDVGRFLHRHRAGKNPAGTTEMRVLALRKDGSDFLAHVTTLTWQWDTAITKKADVSRLCWTAAFRDLGVPSTPPTHRSSDDARVDGSSGKGGSEAASKIMAPSIEKAVAPEVPRADSIESSVPDAAAKIPEQSQKPEVAAGVPVDSAKPAIEVPREDSTTFRTAAQLAASDLKRQIEDLEARLKSATAEIEAAKAESEQRGVRESELRTQLEAAKDATGFVEAVLREETIRKQKAEERLQNLSSSLREEQAERSKRFEEELVSLRQERDELNGKLALEQESAGESTRRAQELELRLGRNASEFQRTRAELERQAAERERSESVWREQLDTAWIAKKEIEGAWAGAVEQNKKFEEELAKLREEHDELQAKLTTEQKSAADSQERAKLVRGRLSRNAADSERARYELDKQAAERELSEASWRRRLAEADALRAKLESSLSEVTARCKQIESELESLRRERDGLNARLAAEQRQMAAAKKQTGKGDGGNADMERIRQQLEEALREMERVRSETGEQVASAKSRSVELERQLADATDRSSRLEQETALLRRDHGELETRLAAEKQATTEARDRAREIEARLTMSSAEVERLRGEMEKYNSSKEEAAANFANQLDVARGQQSKLETLLAEVTEQQRVSLEESGALRRERDGLNARAAVEKQSADENRRKADQLQQRLDQNGCEIEKLNTELKRLRGEHAQSESRWQDLQESANARARKLEAEWAAAVERNVRCEEELADLRGKHEEATLQLRSGRKTSSESAQAIGELERRLERSVEEAKRATGELERVRADRKSDEAAWREQLDASNALAKKLDSAWVAATERARRSELELAAIQREHEELTGKLTVADRETARVRERADALESQVNRTSAELDQLKGSLARFATEPGSHESGWREQLATLRAEKSELEKLLLAAAERTRQLEAELMGSRSSNAKLAPTHRLPQLSPDSGKAVLDSIASPTHPANNAPPQGQTNAVQGASLGPGAVQQYDFDKPKKSVPRREVGPSKRKLQP